MAKRPQLTARKRKILGRKVKQLRKKGLIPAHVYGRGVKSVHISVDGKSFLPVFEETGETGLVDLVIEKQKPRPVLISQVQHHPLTSQILHIDFHQVTLTEKVTAGIPIEVVGQSPAVEEKKGVLLTILDEVEVEALPTDLPENIRVDISGLKKVGDAIKAGDAKVGDKVKMLTGPEEILVKIGSLVTKGAEEEIKAEEEAAAEAAAETETGEAKEKEAVEEKEPPERPEAEGRPEEKSKKGAKNAPPTSQEAS